MKKVFQIGMATLTITALTGCATAEQLGNAQNRIGTLENEVALLEAKVRHIETSQEEIMANQTPPRSYCYLNGERYTEGAVVSGRICDRVGIQRTGQPPNLSWVNHR